MEVPDKKVFVRRLVGRSGRGLAEEWGFPVINNPASLFQLLCLSILLRGRGDYQRGVQTARAMRDRGWDSAARMSRSRYEERFAVLHDVGGRREPHDVATGIGNLALSVVDRYRGDLRRLRMQARHDPGRERGLLNELPAVDDEVVDLFFREVQAVWREIAPFADRRALAAARKLGLGRSAADLASLAGTGESERLAWLVGSLARVDLDNSYDAVRDLVAA